MMVRMEKMLVLVLMLVLASNLRKLEQEIEFLYEGK